MTLERVLVTKTSYSRREVVDFILSGQVRVNKRVIKELGYEISSSDDIDVNGEHLSGRVRYVYYKFYKPKGVISTLDDPKGRHHVGHFLERLKVPVFPVGRLDRQSSGLLLLTNDGDWANHILHPMNACVKTYRVTVDKSLSRKSVQRLLDGFFLEDGPVQYTKVDWEDDTTVSVGISEGRNRIVRRSFAFLGYEVKRLKRLSIGQIQLGKMEEGSIKSLSLRESKLF